MRTPRTHVGTGNNFAVLTWLNPIVTMVPSEGGVARKSRSRIPSAGAVTYDQTPSSGFDQPPVLTRPFAKTFSNGA